MSLTKVIYCGRDAFIARPFLFLYYLGFGTILHNPLENKTPKQI